MPTQQGLTDTIVPWKNIGGPPDYLFSANSAEYVPVTYQAQKEHFAVTVANPTVGSVFADGRLEGDHARRPRSSTDWPTSCSAGSRSARSTTW